MSTLHITCIETSPTNDFQLMQHISNQVAKVLYILIGNDEAYILAFGV